MRGNVNVYAEGDYYCRNPNHNGDRRIKPEDCIADVNGAIMCPQCKKKISTRPRCLKQKAYLNLKRFDL